VAVVEKRTSGVFTDEQEELRDSARRFLAEKSSSAVVRELMATDVGFDQATWKQMAELGWLGIAIPERYGGLGYGFVELFVLLEEMGRRLLPAPFLSSIVFGATVIGEAGTEEQKTEFLPQISDGSLRVALALTEPSAPLGGPASAVRASRSGTEAVLDGTKSHVVDGHSADLLIVSASNGNETGLFLVDRDQDGVTAEPMETMDATRKQAEVRFDSARARGLGTASAAQQALSRTLDRAAIAIAGESVGGARECLEMTIEYAKSRVQFDRPIGSFQALQHRLSDVFMEVEMARSAAYYAAWAAAEDSDEVPVVAPLAKAYCTETYFHAAAETIQVHGGIGFTWEHDAHLYFKRAKTLELLLGDVSYQRELLADRIGL
jgi:alkylation response protein AidB-like acyl-CoA dehydrogenase